MYIKIETTAHKMLFSVKHVKNERSLIYKPQMSLSTVLTGHRCSAITPLNYLRYTTRCCNNLHMQYPISVSASRKPDRINEEMYHRVTISFDIKIMTYVQILCILSIPRRIYII